MFFKVSIIYAIYVIAPVSAWSYAEHIQFYSFYNNADIIRLDYTYTPTPTPTPQKNTVGDADNKNIIDNTVSQPTSITLDFTIQDNKFLKQELVIRPGNHTIYWYATQEGTLQSADLNIPNFLQTQLEYKFYVEPYKINLVQNIHLPTTNIETMLNWKVDRNNIYHHDFYMFRWSAYPDVIVFAFRSRDIQEKYLKRLAFFAEKYGTRGSIQQLKNITHRDGWGAHDYKAEDLALFFNQVNEKNKLNPNSIQLTEQEELLKQILVDARAIIEVRIQKNSNSKTTRGASDGYNKHTETDTTYTINYSLPYSAIASYARSDSPALQRTLLFHELLHTIYFRDKQVRDTVTRLYNRMSDTHKKIWRAFLEFNGYDSTYNYLVKNELFAYLLQRPISDLAWYIPSRILPEARMALSRQESQSFTDTLTQYALQLSEYVESHYQIKSGDVRYVKTIE